MTDTPPTVVIVNYVIDYPVLNLGVTTVIVNQTALGGNLLVVDPGAQASRVVYLSGQGPAGTATAEGVAAFVGGRPLAGETILRYVWTSSVAVSTILSQSSAGVAATASSVFIVKRDPGGVSVGTLTFGIGALTGSFAFTDAVFDPGETLVLIAPSPSDASLADVALTLVGT